MCKNIIEEAFTNYLASDDKLAFQIDSSWGSGKTYTVKHSLIDLSKKEKYTPVYFSINGFNDLTILNTKLNEFTFVSKTIGLVNPDDYNNYLNGFINVFDSEISNFPFIKDLYKPFKETAKSIYKGKINYNHIVLFIDEFERCSIDVELLLGYFSNILENWKCKMVIISNEKSQPKRFNNDYMIQKEKLINKTNKLQLNNKDIEKSIIYNSLSELLDADLLEFIIEASNELSSKIKTYNFRILLSVLSSFKQLVLKIHETDVENSIEIHSLKTAYVSIFVLTDVQKKGFNIDELFKKSGSMFYSMFLNKNIYESKINESFKYIYKHFNFKINSVCLNYLYFTEDLFNLVQNNIFNVNNYLNDISNIFHHNKSEVDVLADKLMNIEELNDEQLLCLEKKILYFSECHLSIKNCFDVVGMYNRLKRIKLWDIKDISKDNISLNLKKEVLSLENYRIGYYYIDMTNDQKMLRDLKRYISLCKINQENKKTEFNLSLILDGKFPNDINSLNDIFEVLVHKNNLKEILTQKSINGIYNLLILNKNVSLKYSPRFVEIILKIRDSSDSKMMIYCIDRLHNEILKLISGG